jgi:hypothetical protein
VRTRNINATEKTGDVSGKDNDHGDQEFQGKTITGKRIGGTASPPKMNPAIPGCRRTFPSERFTDEWMTQDSRKSAVGWGEFWCARRDSNSRPVAPEATALSS